MDRSYATSKDVGEESGWKMISVQIAAKDPSLRVNIPYAAQEPGEFG
jgi:hypothetical protein